MLIFKKKMKIDIFLKKKRYHIEIPGGFNLSVPPSWPKLHLPIPFLVQADWHPIKIPGTSICSVKHQGCLWKFLWKSMKIHEFPWKIHIRNSWKINKHHLQMATAPKWTDLQALGGATLGLAMGKKMWKIEDHLLELGFFSALHIFWMNL